jgi:hypothetical protein
MNAAGLFFSFFFVGLMQAVWKKICVCL